jgi:hypothetical protein
MLPSVSVSASSLAQKFLGNKVSTQTAASGSAGFLKFDYQSGDWTYGRDSEDVKGDEILVNVRTLGHGWVQWSGGRATKNFVSIEHELPIKPPAIGRDEAAEARCFGAAFYDDNKAEKTQLIFETNSFGGRAAVNDLINAIMERVVSGEQTHLFPLVRLGSSSYYNEKYRRDIHTAKFEIVAWCDENGIKQGSAPARIAAPAPAPAQAPAAEAPVEAAAPAEEAAAPAPSRRRRVS